MDMKHYWQDAAGTIRRNVPKLRGKAAVKRAKRERRRLRELAAK